MGSWNNWLKCLFPFPVAAPTVNAEVPPALPAPPSNAASSNNNHPPLAPDLQMDWISSDESSDDDSGIEIIGVQRLPLTPPPPPAVPVVDLTTESDDEVS